MYLRCVILLALTGTAISNYPPCKDVVDKGKLISAVIQDCDPSKVCPLVKGSSKTIDITFTTSADSDILETHVFGLLAGVDIPFPGFKIDACDPKLNIVCPLKANNEYKYTNVINVLPAYPLLDVPVKWQLKDSAGDTIVCFMVNTTIKEPSA